MTDTPETQETRQEWRDISTAPTNTRVLIGGGGCPYVHENELRQFKRERAWSGLGTSQQPTHWMPLPLAPSSSPQEPQTDETLLDRVRAYLLGGGLFNPELANHDAVRDLILELRDVVILSQRREPREPHAALIAEIRAYLVSGGLFNPELANHDNVRDLLVCCLHALKGLIAEKVYVVETPEPDSKILGIFTDKARATAWADKHDAYVETHPLVKGE